MKAILTFIILLSLCLTASSQDTAIFKIRSPKKSIDTINPDVYIYADEMPEFAGGPGALLQYIRTKINFPLSALGGIGYYAFVVNADGSIGKVIVQKGVPDCPECDTEAVRVLSTLPPFIPARKNNLAVPIWIQMPIIFSL